MPIAFIDIEIFGVHGLNAEIYPHYFIRLCFYTRLLIKVTKYNWIFRFCFCTFTLHMSISVGFWKPLALSFIHASIQSNYIFLIDFGKDDAKTIQWSWMRKLNNNEYKLYAIWKCLHASGIYWYLFGKKRNIFFSLQLRRLKQIQGMGYWIHPLLLYFFLNVIFSKLLSRKVLSPPHVSFHLNIFQ